MAFTLKKKTLQTLVCTSKSCCAFIHGHVRAWWRYQSVHSLFSGGLSCNLIRIAYSLLHHQCIHSKEFYVRHLRKKRSNLTKTPSFYFYYYFFLKNCIHEKLEQVVSSRIRKFKALFSSFSCVAFLFFSFFVNLIEIFN